MRDVNEHPTMHGAAQDHDHPATGRSRDDSTSTDGGGVNPGPPQRGGPEETQAGRRPGVSRGDPAAADGGGVNPGPPQRGGPGQPRAGRRPPVTREDPASPDGGDINPPPPQRGDDPPAGGAGTSGHRASR
jgi:hypothetical protein